MSGIYIPGERLPETITEMWIFPNGDVAVFGRNEDITRIRKAIPVPDHGRMIDADAFISFIRENWDSYDQWFAEMLEARPTIIPADLPVMYYPQVDGITPTIIPAEENTDFYTKGHLHLGYAEEGEE